MFCLDSRVFPPINTVLINVSMSNFCRSTLEDSSSPHRSFSALSHLYRTTRLRQSSSRADRLSYPGHRNIRAFRDTSGTAPHGWSSESLCESNSHLALPNTSNLLAWIRLHAGWLMAPTSSLNLGVHILYTLPWMFVFNKNRKTYKFNVLCEFKRDFSCNLWKSLRCSISYTLLIWSRWNVLWDTIYTSHVWCKLDKRGKAGTHPGTGNVCGLAALLVKTT